MRSTRNSNSSRVYFFSKILLSLTMPQHKCVQIVFTIVLNFIYIYRVKLKKFPNTFTGTHKEHNFAKCERWMINPAWVRPPRFHFFKKAWFLPNQQSLSKTAYSYFHCKPLKSSITSLLKYV